MKKGYYLLIENMDEVSLRIAREVSLEAERLELFDPKYVEEKQSYKSGLEFRVDNSPSDLSCQVWLSKNVVE